MDKAKNLNVRSRYSYSWLPNVEEEVQLALGVVCDGLQMDWYEQLASNERLRQERGIEKNLNPGEEMETDGHVAVGILPAIHGITNDEIRSELKTYRHSHPEDPRTDDTMWPYVVNHLIKRKRNE